jgi:hypothetical protein
MTEDSTSFDDVIIEELEEQFFGVPFEIPQEHLQKFIKLQLFQDLRGKKTGQIIKLKTDKDYVPYDIYWKRRLKDAEFDNCVVIVEYIN